MSKFGIAIERTNEWVLQQRIATGENVPERIKVEVDPLTLSVKARTFWLSQTWDHEFRCIEGFNYNSQFNWTTGSGYGKLYPVVDATEPTAEQIDAAILALDTVLAGKRAEYEAAKANREQEEADRKAAAEEKNRKIAEARELLADELAKIKSLESDRKLLADFLECFPADAKRGALKKLAEEHADATVNSLRKKIEDASPIWVLSDLDDDGEDDE